MSNPYATVAQFRANSLVSGSFDPTPEFPGVTDAVVQYWLDAAAFKVDNALRPRHSLPLSTVSEGLSSWVIIMAAYRCLGVQGAPPGTNTGIIKAAYEEVCGTPANPYSGELWKLETGRTSLGHGIDAVATNPTPLFPVVESGSRDRGWMAHDPNTGRDYII